MRTAFQNKVPLTPVAQQEIQETTTVRSDRHQTWKLIQGMLGRQQHNDAFILALKAFTTDDELPMIKLLTKLKCKLSYPQSQHVSLAFEYDKLYEQQREDLVKCSLDLLESGDFQELLLPCLGEAVDKFGVLMSRSLKLTVAERLKTIMSQIEDKKEVKRIIEKCISTNK